MIPNKFIIYIFLLSLIIFSCGRKKSDVNVSPEGTTESSGNISNDDPKDYTDVERNIDAVIEDLHMEIKKLKAEVEYQYESMSKIEAQSQLWTNPFSIYNKEIVLNNGTSIFRKIVYQDQD